MKIYLAHNFEAREWLREGLKEGLWKGHEITSRWIIDGPHSDGTDRVLSAHTDLEDIDKADYLVLFLDSFRNQSGREKWFEFGYALAKHKLILLLGEDKSCVFTNLDDLRIYKLSAFASQERLLGLLENMERHLYTGVRKE